ncbi:biliverdin-producing heme oxygenase [Spirosoma agri]|uniref:Biliverdin-producing heme oxygenase n=1 Tax=Spirosoma agri TaxID=1987381 RepID=A0A6M0IED7_9BACT|nr:biliverdin-producing heme oxygenase [Spirosoma agri]NEU66197.1 biliverdin-producing heme oxygenase [Spirosoma agri]
MISLPERLRHETRPEHEQTEVLFYTESLQNGTLTVGKYSHLLRTHLVFHRALESAIDRYPAFFQEYDATNRQKTPWLLADLAALHVPEPQESVNLFADWSPVELLGAAYVGEGSMLGGTVIWKMLQHNQAVLPLLTHARFFRGYGSETGTRWRTFSAFLVQRGVDFPDEVVTSAKHAFTAYQTVFQQTKE